MQDISFSIDFTALIVALFIAGFLYLMWSWSKIFQSPHIKFSNLSGLMSEKPGFREAYKKLPQQLLIGAFALFFFAFMDPHFYVPREKVEKEEPMKQVNIPTEGIAVYLVLDQSGSMAGQIKARNSQGRWVQMTKMDLLKQVTTEFVKGEPEAGLQGRSGDMLGLVAFARGAQVLAPLTLDHQSILKELEKLNYTADFDQDGTAIGYAIFKTANLITATRHYAQDLAGEGIPAYEIKSNVMILVTDGFQSPNPLDKNKRLRNIELVEAADYARANKIKLYIINVEPKMAIEEFALHRKLMKQIAELTGGQFYLVDSSMDLEKIYSEIDQLEKSTLPVETRFAAPPKSQQPDLYRRISLHPFFISLGMLFIAASTLLETIFMRRVP
jgi:Ca-activated chloride channel family protein